MKNKIYCFNNGGSPGWMSAIAIAEDGNVLAEHCCSHESFMRHDLGVVGTWKHELYDKHYGQGNWELVWVDDCHKSPELDAAIALNEKLPKSIPDDVKAGVTLEFDNGTKVTLP